MSLLESGAYPPGSENDPNAPWNDFDTDSDYADAEASIEALDGQQLYESPNHDIDAELDVFESNHFRLYDSSRNWNELSAGEQALWNTYAEVRQGFAYLLIKD